MYKRQSYIRTRHPDLPIIPLLNNWNGRDWEGVKVGRVLASQPARTRVIEQLLAYVERHNFAGISIDFENIPTKAQPDFQRFMAELYTVFHPKNLSVSVNVPASDPAFDYRKLASSADYLILMAYDEHLSLIHILPSIDHMNIPFFLVIMPLAFASSTYFPLESDSLWICLLYTSISSTAFNSASVRGKATAWGNWR